jgi:hypothetical protein
MAGNEKKDLVASKQREVQRKLGRCLLRLQQLEQLLKALWVDHESFVCTGDVVSAQERRRNYISDKTLGSVVKELVGSYIKPNLDKPDEPSRDNDDDPTRVSFRITSNLSVSENQFLQIKAQLAELVELRNELVHHFIEQFDVWTEAGCVAAETYLESCYTTIDQHFGNLRDWAKATHQARVEAASWLTSQEGRDWLIYGIFPDGRVDWASTPIVASLRQAEEVLSKDGWTQLVAAIAFIRERNQDLTPQRYGCIRWRHVIHESQLFEIRKQRTSDSAAAEVWYRGKGQ